MKSGSSPSQLSPVLPQGEGLQPHLPQHPIFPGPIDSLPPRSPRSHWVLIWGAPVRTGDSKWGRSEHQQLHGTACVRLTYMTFGTSAEHRDDGRGLHAVIPSQTEWMRPKFWLLCTCVASLVLIKLWKWRIPVSKIQIRHWYLALLQVLSIGLPLSKWRMKQRGKILNSD